MDSLKTDFSSFEEKMKQLDITQKEFANFLDINYTSIHKWKKKGSVPKYAAIALKYIESTKNDMEVMRGLKTLCRQRK